MLLEVYNKDAHKYEQIKGTEDWVEVINDDGDSSYEWAQMKAYYSPSVRRYFWHSDSGCSCTSWSDDITGVSSFQDGSKADLLRAWGSFTADSSFHSEGAYISGVATINNFEPPKGT